MKWFYRKNTFSPRGTDSELGEMYYGEDQYGSIYYPNVSTCTTVTVLLGDNRMLGAHFDKIASATDIGNVVARMNTDRGTRAVKELCIVGVLKYASAGGWMTDDAYRWPKLFDTFSKALGHTGAINGYLHPLGTEKHYRVTSASGVTIWFAKDVPMLAKGSGTSSASLAESRSVAWDALTLTKW